MNEMKLEIHFCLNTTNIMINLETFHYEVNTQKGYEIYGYFAFKEIF